MNKVLCHIVLVFCFLLNSGPTFAQDEPAEVKHYKEMLDVLANSADPEKLWEARELILRFPTDEAYIVIKERLETMPENGSQVKATLKAVVLLLTETFVHLGTAFDAEMLTEVAKWAKNLSNKNVDNALQKAIKEVAKFDQIKRDGLADLSEITDKLVAESSKNLPVVQGGGAHERALEEVREFYETLSRKVIGQEEIVRALETLYLKDIRTNGRRTKPEVFYMLGLPGNGKDTIVEAYADALAKKEGAYNERVFSMKINNRQEAWTLFGSAKGYIGSEDLPALLKFLVLNSGGKYVLAEEPTGKGESRQVIERNPNWKPEHTSFAQGPHKAIVFVNEAHNIPKEVKDTVLKEAIEKGRFKINNPGSGPNAVSQIEVNVTFMFASNEGISLLEPRERNGARSGEPLTYERLLENWERVYRDKKALKQAVLRANGGINDATSPEAPGTSEEFLNRFEKHIFLLRPLSPESLIRVAEIKSNKMSQEVATAEGPLGRYQVEVTSDLIRFITEYNYIASENARPIGDRLELFVYDEIDKAIKRKRIRATGGDQIITVDVHPYKNGAHSVVFNVRDAESGEEYRFTRLVEQTLKDVPKTPISRERINEILSMRETILSNVFGVEHIVDRLLDAALVTEKEARNAGKSKRPATVMAFLGLTSTGKTETAIQYVKARYGTTEAPTIIDFNGVRSLEAMEAKILGSYDRNKNPIDSEFAKAYDRAPDGNIAFIFDEAANAPKELLKALYEILRAPEARGFTDGKPRQMKNVTIILTGNAGEQIYDAIPRNIPDDVRERAQHEVFRLFMRDEAMQHEVLKQNFPEALIARLGRNIFHFGPLSDTGKRQVAQLKLLQGLNNLRPKASEEGWKIKFGETSDLLRTFDMIEKEGFHISHQGASIDKFVRLEILDRIKARLTREAVPNGQEVVLEILPDLIEITEREVTNSARRMRLTTGGQEYYVDIPLPSQSRSSNTATVDRALTGYHEVGHEVVSEVFMGDRVRPSYLSIIDGVTKVGNAFVHYAGIRAGTNLEQTQPTKEAILRNAAVFAGGYVAQQIVTMGGRDDGGKSNDMERATQMIQNGILRAGLSRAWGTRGIPQGVSTEDYIEKELSPAEKETLNQLTNQWLKEAEKMAREAIYLNIDTLFFEMSQELVEKGFLGKEEILKIYEKYNVVTEHSSEDYEERLREVREVIEVIDKGVRQAGDSFHQRFSGENYDLDRAEEAFKFLFRRSAGLMGWVTKNPWNSFTPQQQLIAAAHIGRRVIDRKRDARFAGEYWVPEKVADIEEILKQKRQEMTEAVTKVDRFEFVDNKQAALPPALLSCRRVFAQ